MARLQHPVHWGVGHSRCLGHSCHARPTSVAPATLGPVAAANDVRRVALALPHVDEIDSDGFDFRVAHKLGYGASPGMVRRCLERLDEERITGEVRILRSLADTEPVETQGPVWYIGGRSV